MLLYSHFLEALFLIMRGPPESPEQDPDSPTLDPAQMI